jgi:hypothetical protein
MKTPYYSVRQNLPYNNTYEIKIYNEFNMPILNEIRSLKGKYKNKIIATYTYGYDKDNKLMSIVILEGNKNRTLTVSKAARAADKKVYTLENALANNI